jgi:hypothetical protein
LKGAVEEGGSYERVVWKEATKGEEGKKLRWGWVDECSFLGVEDNRGELASGDAGWSL